MKSSTHRLLVRIDVIIAIMPDSPKKNSVDSAHKMKTSKKSGSKKIEHHDNSKMGKQLSDDDDDDMVLSKPLFPLQKYIGSRTELVEQLFKSISRGNLLQTLLPEILKEIPTTELKVLCVQQLEVMSKKRIVHILSGQEMESSSGTDDSDIDSTSVDPKESLGEVANGDPALQVADSTSTDAGDPNVVPALNNGKFPVKVEDNSIVQSPSNCDLLELHPDSADHVMLDSAQDTVIKSEIEDEPKNPVSIADTEDESMPVVATSSMAKTCMEILELELRARAIKSLINAQAPSSELEAARLVNE